MQRLVGEVMTCFVVHARFKPVGQVWWWEKPEGHL